MFGKVWDNAKHIFTSALKWVTNLGSLFWNAGANIVNSVWKGMKAMANKPVEAIAQITSKIRDYLPFSPAKQGAFRTLHRTKIVETIAQSMKPDPVFNTMRKVTNQIYQPAQIPAISGYGGAPSFHFAPVIQLQGSATKQDADMISARLKSEMNKWWKDMNANKSRVGF